MVLLLCGCQNTGQQGATPGHSLFGPAVDVEKWTIRCCRIETPNHVQEAETLTGMLKKVAQLDARKVRVATDTSGSTIYYGEYHRVSSPTTGQLVFPPALQKDIEFIRGLSADNMPNPFFRAQPELVAGGPPSAHPEWEVSNVKGTHSLLSAVFYNTPTFNERKQVAEQYVELLRKDGFPAYYHHEAVKSFVFVGDFNESDIIATPEGPRPSPRVEQLISRRPEEFRHFTENGHIRHELGAKGAAPFSVVMPVPKKDASGLK
jgi:hypothetical protein